MELLVLHACNYFISQCKMAYIETASYSMCTYGNNHVTNYTSLIEPFHARFFPRLQQKGGGCD